MRDPTVVVKGRTDMNIGTFRRTNMWDGCLDSVESSELIINAHRQPSQPRSLSEHTVSISMTVLNAFSDRPEIGARKFPAAPE